MDVNVHWFKLSIQQKSKADNGASRNSETSNTHHGYDDQREVFMREEGFGLGLERSEKLIYAEGSGLKILAWWAQVGAVRAPGWGALHFM